MSQTELDCKGMKCPMPIVNISKTMRTMSTGDILVVEASDPAFEADLRAWAKRFGHEIRSFEPGSEQRATIVKS